MAYLIDTDIIIYSIKGNLKVQEKFREKEAIPKAISIITYGELLYGAKKSIQPEKNAAIVYRLVEIFPIVGITRSVIEAFAEIKRSLEIRGERLADLVYCLRKDFTQNVIPDLIRNPVFLAGFPFSRE